MAFPADPLGTRVELRVGDTWTDITSDVYLSDGITITRGRREYGALTDPGKCNLTLKNLDGKYSPRNPRSPYYGLIGRNTPLRVSVHTGDPYLALDGGPTGYVSTPDTAALDITGDIDIRVEASIDWQDTDTNQVLISKWQAAGNQRSYALRVYDGRLWLDWSTDGTLTGGRQAWMTLPTLPRHRAAVRVTLDVDNGAGQFTVRFYWAESIAGPWEQIDDDIIGSTGVTQIFASTTPLHIGHHDPLPAVPQVPPPGRVYAVQILNGIGGTPVVDVDFTAQEIGATSFTDDAGITWTVQGTAEITNRQERFTGEVSEWPPRWGVTGKLVRVPIEASGILRRLRQGTKALDSTLRRRVPSGDPIAYWPMEEGEGATQAYSPIPGVPPMATPGVQWAQDDTLPGSAPLPTLPTGASIHGSVPRGAGQGWHVEMVYKINTDLPGSMTTFMRLDIGGATSIRHVLVRASSSAIRVEVRDADDSVLAFNENTDAGALSDFTGDWARLQIYTVDTGSQVEVYVWWIVITNVTWFVSTAVSTSSPGEVLAVTTGTIPEAWNGLSIGHIAVFERPPGTTITTYDGADHGFTGETALTRMYRLSREEGFPLARYDGDDSADSAWLGPQRPDTTLALVQAAADADGGILYEQRDTLGLIYRDRTSLYNQAPRLVLDYTAPGEVAPPLEPVDDDEGLVNDVTVRREGGSSARVVLEDGPLSVQDPPDGVGRYDTEITRNLADDAQTVQHAGWLLHLGTWDEARVPTVRVDLKRAPHLIPDVLAVDIGDRMQVANPPAWLPPDTIDLHAQGYTERIGVRTWDWEATCSPAGPWEVGVRDDPDRGRRDTSGSELAAPVDADDTTWQVATTSGPPWTTDAADFPFDVVVGGERVTVTACSGTSSPQTWTVVRSVNGISKSHAAGTSVRLARPAVRAL